MIYRIDRFVFLVISALALSGCATSPPRTALTYSHNDNGTSNADGCAIGGIVYGYSTEEDMQAGRLSRLPGAVVLVEGTGKGANTLVDGSFNIGGLKSGTYSVTAKMMGFQTTTRREVLVSMDRKTFVYFYLPWRLTVLY